MFMEMVESKGQTAQDQPPNQKRHYQLQGFNGRHLSPGMMVRGQPFPSRQRKTDHLYILTPSV